MSTPRATAPSRVVRPAPAEAIPPTWGELSALRWGPGVTDGSPSIVIPHDWRSEVANLPAEEWSRWRQLSTELLEGQDDEPDADDIRAAGRLAYDLIRGETGSE